MKMVKCCYAILDFSFTDEKEFDFDVSDKSVKKTEPGFKGLYDSDLYYLSYGDIAIAVSEIWDYRLKINNECVLEYAKITEDLSKNYSLLPFRFGTVFEYDSDIEKILKKQYDKFHLNLQRVKNKLEFGLKIMWDYENADQKILTSDYLKESRKIFDAPEGSSPSRKYLVDKYKNYIYEEAHLKSADNIINNIYPYLEEVSSSGTFKKMLTKKIILDANFLVEKGKEDNFINRVKELEQERKNLKFLITGPWPPYSFSDNYKEELLNGLQ